MREPPELLAKLYTTIAFHRWKRHAASLSNALDRRERDAVLEAYKKGNKELKAYAYTAPRLNSSYREYLYLTGNVSEDGDEVDTDNLGPKPEATGKKEQFYDTAEEASPDLTTSGDNVHLGAAVSPVPMLTEEEREKLESEMKQCENDIAVLQDVLHNKLERLQTIRRSLGLETNQNFFKHSFVKLRESDAYKKTSEKMHDVSGKITNSEVYQKTGVVLKSAGEKTTAALSSMGTTMSRKLGDMRNSNTFKSFEERMGTAYSSVRTRMTGSRSEDDIQVNVALPEQKVPM